jgi:two-component sensor histidine kinase
MSRTSYPIARHFLIVILLMGFSANHAAAQQIITRNISTGFFQSQWFLLMLFILLISFSIIYRKFMYNRLLASKKSMLSMPEDQDTDPASSIDGLLDQVVLGNTQDNVKTHTQVVNNLLNTIGLLQQQATIFQREMVTTSLHETSQRLFTLTLLQSKIYQKAQLEMVDLHELVPILIDHFSAIGNKSRIRFIYSSTARSIELPVQQAVPMTYFINEVLASFGSVKSENYFSESVGFYLQETKGLVKLTVRTEGLHVPQAFTSLKQNLHQHVLKYFPNSLDARLSIEQSLGTSIHLQFSKQSSKVPVIY